MQALWSFYVTITLAILAFFGAANRTRLTAWLTTIVFVAFAVLNWGGLAGVAQQRLDLCRAITHMECLGSPISIQQPFAMTLNPPTIRALTVVHAAADILTIFGIWVLTLRREAKAKAEL